jgi:hypothetical protein
MESDRAGEHEAGAASAGESGTPGDAGRGTTSAAGRDELQNEFSWSRSRVDQFDACRRRYYYNYYASWGGWKATAPERTRRIYVLKQLKSRHVWAGIIVHDVVEQVLHNLQRGISLRSEEEAVAAALGRMRREFRDSRAGRYWQRPKSLALFEHEYESELDAAVWKENADHVATCIRNFFRSDVYDRLRSVPAGGFLEIETLSSFVIAGIKVWVKLDCCLESGPGVFIIDWKTGRADRERHAGQIASYALYAAHRWGAQPRQIQTLVYNLSIGEGQTYTMTEETVAQARQEIVDSAAAMRGYLADEAANEPLPEESFELAPDERV